MLKGDREATHSVIERLRREHAEMDRRVHELERRPFLSPAEEVERLQLKKLKLHAKDRIVLLEREITS